MININTKFKTDIEIATEANLENIYAIAKKLNISEEYVEPYGKFKAKINTSIFNDYEPSNLKKESRLILVTAISPTPAGEGKTTTSVGLTDALSQLGKNVVVCLREPSLGPVFGMKGGAAGGGYAQVVPMEDINLHFTGDLHAITSANNLIAAMLDNHIYQGNVLNIDPRRVTWKRVIDMNDRQLRSIISGLNSVTNGIPRQDGFDITVASEIMAIFCLASTLDELKEKISNITVAYTYDNKPITVKDIKAEGAVTTLLKDAFNPNLVQTLEGTPAIIHGGPFANIAHGCNSIIATKLAKTVADVVVTEAGFGADLGAEKFFNIKCRKSGLKPNVVVLVATVRALKYQSGLKVDDLKFENLEALRNGASNLIRHIDNIKNEFGIPVVVALNKFPTDTDNEVNLIKEICSELGVKAEISDVFSKGGVGGIDLAKAVIENLDTESEINFTYSNDTSLVNKINAVSTKIYKAKGVKFATGVLDKLKSFEEMGYGDLPICMAKTQYSFSDNMNLLGAPTGFEISIQDVQLNSGAGFIVCIAGNIMRMPGLPKKPAAENITIDGSGNITGLS